MYYWADYIKTRWAFSNGVFLLLLFSRCPHLLMEVFIKVSIQSVLAMTLKDDERFNSVWLWLFEFGFANSFIKSFIPLFADSRIKGGAKISIQSYFHGDTFFSVHSAKVMCQTKIILLAVNCRLWLAGLGRKERKGAKQTSFALASVPGSEIVGSAGI